MLPIPEFFALSEANVLSNFYPNAFVLDGIPISCMEAFLRSTKCPDPEYQKVICLMEARQAKNVGGTYHWQKNGLLADSGDNCPSKEVSTAGSIMDPAVSLSKKNLASPQGS